MELNGIRGIYVAYSPWKDLDMIWNRPPGPRISQNGLDQSTPLTSRPLLAKSTSCLATKSNQDIFPDIYDDIQIRMIINDYQDASCCLIKNDQYIYMPTFLFS